MLLCHLPLRATLLSGTEAMCLSPKEGVGGGGRNSGRGSADIMSFVRR